MRIVVPPLDTSISEKRPTVGLAVIPDNPSEPPHFIPMISSLALTFSRLNVAA